MREILFRGKRIDDGEWVEGFYVRLGSKDDHILTGKLSIVGFAFVYEHHPVIPETVGQYTGLTVANGKVFDGDIIRLGGNLYLVFWKEEAFQWQVKRIDTALEICIAAEPIITGETTTEIVGNIHDNPELLGGEL